MTIQALTAETVRSWQTSHYLSAATRKKADTLAASALVEKSTVTTATVRLSVPTGKVYTVTFQQQPGYLFVQCNCGRFWGTTCEHAVAAGAALVPYLREHPPAIWKAALDAALAVKRPKPSATPRRLVFSLQPRSSGIGRQIVAYTIANAMLPPGGDMSDEFLRTTPDLKRLASRLTPDKVPGATDDEIVAANMIVTAGQVHYAYYANPANQDPADSLLKLLTNARVFLGRDAVPCEQPVTISLDPIAIAIEIDSTADGGLRLMPRIGDDDGTDSDLVIADPPWVRVGSTIAPAQGTAAMVKSLLDLRDVIVPARDCDEFLTAYLPTIAERAPVRGDALQFVEVDTPPVPRLYLADEHGALDLRVRFGYGDYEVTAARTIPGESIARKPAELTVARIRRDAEAEAAAIGRLPTAGLKRGTTADQWLLRANVTPVDFLITHVPKLVEAGFEIFGEEAATATRINRSRPTIQIAVSSGIDWFDLAGAVQFGDQTLSLAALRRAIRHRERYVKLADGTIGVIPPEWIEQYRHLFSLADESGDRLRVGTFHGALVDELLGMVDTAATDRAFAERRERLRAVDRIEPVPPPVQLRGAMRPYQHAGYEWLHFLHAAEFGGCLADDMGTGKTIQTLALLQQLRESGHVRSADLVVVPRSLLFNWVREADRFAPSLRVLVQADGSRASDPAAFDDYDLVLTTYGLVLRDIDRLRKYRFHYAILDEAQAVKNPLGATSKAVRLLQADHRLALTGTPIENSTAELWSLFAFLNPGLLGSYETFRDTFQNPIERNRDEASLSRLRALIYPFLLRRTKDQVAPDLPARTERVAYCAMEPDQQAVYVQTRDYYRGLLLGLIDDGGLQDARLRVLEGLLRLRQICDHPRLVDTTYAGSSAKLDLLLETVETLAAEGRKVLVFSQFVAMLTIIRSALDARGLRYAYLDGKTRDRQSVVDAFQTDPSLPVFLISLKAGGVGLNLTAAEYVVHVDPWWNPAVERQATDRTHRIGQERPVFVDRLVVRDTVEEKVLTLQDSKRALADALITTDSSVFKSLTRDDIAALFS